MNTLRCHADCPSLARNVLSAAWMLRKLLLASLCLVCLAGARAAEYRAFWVDGWNTGFRSQAQVDSLLGKVGDSSSLGNIRSANCNTVFVQVRRRFDTCYPSGVGEPYMSGLSPANFNALQAMINAAHDTTGGKKRIEVHGWFVTFETGGGQVFTQHRSTPTGNLTNYDNYWPTRNDSGVETNIFDPGHPLVLQYIVNACMDMATNFNLDGIHYDYVRFTGNNHGYNPTSVARYNARYGLTGQPASSSEQFKQWRRDQVTAVVRQTYAKLQKHKPSVRQSGSFVTWNPSPTTSTRAGFQATRPYYDNYSDWDSWMQEGIMDMAVPMTYYDWASLPSDYTKWMNFEKDRHGNRHMIIGPGLYMNSRANSILVIQKTRDPSPAGNYCDGFSGYSYWEPFADGTWSDFSPTFVSQVTPTWDDVPAMPWKTAPTNGHLMGTVTQDGTSIWADHTVVSIAGPVSRSQYVDGTGFYAFIDLPPGTYTITASKTGYPNAVSAVAVAIGEVTGNMYERNFVLTPVAPASIVSQPQSRLVAAGANTSFGVTASGTPPLFYQWRKDGVDLLNATNATLALSGVQPADNGIYSVVVSNAYGAATSSNALLTVITNPVPAALLSQPQGTNVLAGQTAVFVVTAAGTAPLSFQWRQNGTALGGATSATLTLSNVQASQAGQYAVVVTNAFGAQTSTVATLNVLLPPSITTQPQNKTVLAGQNATFGVVVTGTPVLAYQWRLEGVNLPGATGTNLALTAVAAGQAGRYDVVITNDWGAVTSQVATLTVNVPSGRVEKLWQLAPYSRPYLTTNDLPFERSLSYNRVNHHILIASRSNHIYVLDAETGAHLYELKTNGVTGGQYQLLMMGVADDGVVYAGNLSTSTLSPAYKLYRWANDGANTVPTVAFSGDPSPGTSQRWGDSIEVRGAGVNTQVLISPRQASIVALLTTTDGTNFTSRTITLTDTPSGYCSLGLAFGPGNTFFGTTFSNTLRKISFDPIAGTGITTRLYTTTEVPSQICPIGYSPELNLLGGVYVFSPSHLRVYDMTLTNGTPVLLGSTNFPADNSNTHTGAGAVDFSSNTIYAIEANNGVMALRIFPAVTPPAVVVPPQDITALSGDAALFDVTATGTEPLAYQWRLNGTNLPGANGLTWYKPLVRVPDAGSYAVVVSNAGGAVTSQAATLTVVRQPARFEEILWQPGGSFRLLGSGEPGGYIIEATSTPFSNWIALTNVVLNTNGGFELLDPVTNAPRRFYRMNGQ